VNPVPFYAVEGAREHYAWLRRLATTQNPQLAAMFRQMADDLAERLNQSKDAPQ